MIMECSNQSASSCYQPNRRRKRGLRSSSFLVASAVALSNSCVTAFQSPSQTYFPQRTIRRLDTRLGVVTDPTHLMSTGMSSNDDHRSALEEIYLLSTEAMPSISVETETMKRKKRPSKPASRRKGRIVKVPKGSLAPSRVRKEHAPVAAITKNARQRKLSARSKSSTMPGFQKSESNLQTTIRLQEERTGIKIPENEKMKSRAKQGLAMYKGSLAVPESMVQFATEIHKIDRITPKEELILGEKTQEAIRIQNIYDQLENQLEREPTDDEWCAAAGKINMEAISQAIDEGLEAKNKLVESNLRMVQGVVNVYIRNGLRGQYNAGDLMQEGIMALVRAAEKYDPSRGFRFSTYAMYWIRSAVKRSQIYQSRVITVPQRLFENHKRLNRVHKQMAKDLGRSPTKKELGDAVGMSTLQIDRCCAAMAQTCYSLDSPLSNPNKPTDALSDKCTLSEVISQNANDGDHNALKHAFLREDLLETLNRHLSEEEVRLLMLRYGLEESTCKLKRSGSLTIAEVSQLVGMKPDKVRRKINRSLKRLKVCIGDEWRDFERVYEA